MSSAGTTTRKNSGTKATSYDSLVNASIFDLVQNDYIELYGRFNTSSGTITFDSTESIFQGYRVA